MTHHSAPFITIEGVDGAGKSTHMDALVEVLRSRGFDVVQTREPGGTDLGATLRNQLKTIPMQPRTAALVAFADRNEHLFQKIEPALAAGKAVISDRFTDSTFGYQVGGDGCDWEFAASLENMVHGHCKPDLTLFFDLSSEQAARRRNARKAETAPKDLDLFDEKDLAFFERVRNVYMRRIEESPSRYRVIDSSGTIDQVQKLAVSALEGFLDEWTPSQPRVRSARP